MAQIKKDKSDNKNGSNMTEKIKRETGNIEREIYELRNEKDNLLREKISVAKEVNKIFNMNIILLALGIITFPILIGIGILVYDLIDFTNKQIKYKDLLNNKKKMTSRMYQITKQLQNKTYDLKHIIVTLAKQERDVMKGNNNEKRVSNYICKFLNNDFYLLNDIAISYKNKTAQVDHVLICKKGIFLLETKSQSGKLYPYSEEKFKWFPYDTYAENYTLIDSHMSQCSYHTEAYKSFLKRNKDIYSILVLASENASWHGKSEYYGNYIVQLNGLKDLIYDIIENKEDIFNNTEINEIIEKLIENDKIYSEKHYDKY